MFVFVFAFSLCTQQLHFSPEDPPPRVLYECRWGRFLAGLASRASPTPSLPSIVEKATPVVGGPLTPGTPYRLKHFASAKYLTVERGPGGAYRPAVTAAVPRQRLYRFPRAV